MTIVEKEPIRAAFEAAFIVRADARRSLDDQIEEAIAAVSKQMSLPPELVRQAVEAGAQES